MGDISKSVKKWNTMINRILKTGLTPEGKQIPMLEYEQFMKDLFRSECPLQGKKQLKKA